MFAVHAGRVVIDGGCQDFDSAYNERSWRQLVEERHVLLARAGPCWSPEQEA